MDGFIIDTNKNVSNFVNLDTVMPRFLNVPTDGTFKRTAQHLITTNMWEAFVQYKGLSMPVISGDNVLETEIPNANPYRSKPSNPKTDMLPIVSISFLEILDFLDFINEYYGKPKPYLSGYLGNDFWIWTNPFAADWDKLNEDIHEEVVSEFQMKPFCNTFPNEDGTFTIQDYRTGPTFKASTLDQYKIYSEDGHKHPGSDDLNEIAWTSEQLKQLGISNAPVMTKKPNAYGVYDLLSYLWKTYLPQIPPVMTKENFTDPVNKAVTEKYPELIEYFK